MQGCQCSTVRSINARAPGMALSGIANAVFGTLFFACGFAGWHAIGWIRVLAQAVLAEAQSNCCVCTCSVPAFAPQLPQAPLLCAAVVAMAFALRSAQQAWHCVFCSLTAQQGWHCVSFPFLRSKCALYLVSSRCGANQQVVRVTCSAGF
jgi:hypothetical protein